MRRSAPLVLGVILAALTACGADGRHVTAADVTPWPFSVPSGTLRCSHDQVTFQPDGGVIYAINGTAKAFHAGRDLIATDPLWLDDTSTGVTLNPPLKVSISKLIQEGLELCR